MTTPETLHLAVALLPAAVAVVAGYIAGRLGSRQAHEQAAAAWRGLAEARNAEVAEIRSDLERLKLEMAILKDDKHQLKALNAQLLAENGSLRQRVNTLEAEVRILSRQVAQDHLAAKRVPPEAEC